MADSKKIFAASPYVTLTDHLVRAAFEGKSVRLIVGLNHSTDPKALNAVLNKPNLGVRFYTGRRFHAKLFLFDNAALVGSSNLTNGGMHDNREATLLVQDPDTLLELRGLYENLWASAPVLTPHVLDQFTKIVGPFGKLFDPDQRIEDGLGKFEPKNIAAGSERKSSEYTYIEALRELVYNQYKPAFQEVSKSLARPGFHRSEWKNEDSGSETNRFLNWVRLTFGPGNDWQKSPLIGEDARRSKLDDLGREWVKTLSPRIADNYFENLLHLRTIFKDSDSLKLASKDSISKALMGIHAFEEQIRFVKGGYSAIIDFFWQENLGDVERVKRSLNHLLFGKEEFISRLYEVLYFPEWKIRYFGESCALELSGTVNPDMCPPMNGRSAKGLRYIGFNVPAH